MSGWICPKCNKVYGPSVEQCRMCNLLNEVPKKPQYTNFRREFGRCMKSLRADFDKAAEEMHAYDLTDTPKRAEPHPASPEPKALDLADERSPLPTDSQEFIDGFNAGFRRAKKIAERLRTKATTEEGSQE